jgi:hypothetical protein
MSKPKAEEDINCPSSQPDSDQSVIFGVVVSRAEARQVGYLGTPIPASAETLSLAAPVLPTEVFRIAGPCAKAGCKHFVGNNCALAQRIVRRLPPVVGSLPACGIRPTCRWFRQEGKAACLRCPQVITFRHDASELDMQVALGEAGEADKSTAG